MIDRNQEHPDERVLHEYLDGELDPNLREKLDTHLVSCSECSERLDNLSVLFQRLESVPELPLERDLTPSVERAIRSNQQRQGLLVPRAVGWVIIAQSMAAALIVALLWPFLSEGVSTIFGNLSTPPALIASWNTILELEHVLASVVDSLIRSIPDGLEGHAQFPSISLSSTSLWVLVGIGALLWLIGNGLLLRLNGHKSREVK
ncbi:MAG: hypothetical protein GTO18_21815 [Anaerolineales bacterium]|nr:hypothetical protein [Anaerolineales bacterium]